MNNELIIPLFIKILSQAYNPRPRTRLLDFRPTLPVVGFTAVADFKPTPDASTATGFRPALGLTTAPALSATTLADFCYYGMFDGCTKRNSVTMLATDISAD